MYRLEKTFRFESSHHLPSHCGKCRRKHGHSFVGIAVCEGPKLQADGSSRGMLIDYADMKKCIDPMVETYLDHYDLNETLAPFGVTDPTSENIATWIYNWLKPNLPLLAEIVVEETCTARCVYRPSEERDV